MASIYAPAYVMAVHPALRRTAALADPWLAPLALMALIFFFSAQPDLSSGLGLLDLIGRKIIHAAEYALLALLWWRALRTVAAPGPALGWAFAIAVAYAASDEYHQTFVEGRHGSPLDVAIDGAGAAAAVLALRRRARVRQRR